MLNSNDTISNVESGERITQRLKEIIKRRALRGKQTVEFLINSAGKGTVVHLIPSFFLLLKFLLGYASFLAAQRTLN